MNILDNREVFKFHDHDIVFKKTGLIESNKFEGKTKTFDLFLQNGMYQNI